jgi:hypothetical protein
MRFRRGVRYSDRVPDRDCLPANEDLFHQQPQDLLPLGHVQCLAPRLQSCTEIGERLDQSQIFGLIAGGRFQRLQFSLNGLIVLAEFWHPATELLETRQTFLVGNQQAVHSLRQSCTIPAQLICALF